MDPEKPRRNTIKGPKKWWRISNPPRPTISRPIPQDDEVLVLSRYAPTSQPEFWKEEMERRIDHGHHHENSERGLQATMPPVSSYLPHPWDARLDSFETDPSAFNNSSSRSDKPSDTGEPSQFDTSSTTANPSGFDHLFIRHDEPSDAPFTNPVAADSSNTISPQHDDTLARLNGTFDRLVSNSYSVDSSNANWSRFDDEFVLLDESSDDPVTNLDSVTLRSSDPLEPNSSFGPSDVPSSRPRTHTPHYLHVRPTTSADENVEENKDEEHSAPLPEYNSVDPISRSKFSDINTGSVDSQQAVSLKNTSPSSAEVSVKLEKEDPSFENFYPPRRAPRLGGQGHVQKESMSWNERSKRDTRAYRPLSYKPLTESGFRVLILSPGEEGSEIMCRLQQFDLTNPPRYEALSYVWGHEPPIHRIEVGNRPVYIRPNLFYALQRVRDRTQSLLLWVDSLCINQHDNLERNAQVRRMASIFQNAQNVCIWLGEEDSTSKIAMEFIPQVGPQFLRDRLWWKHYGFAAFNKLIERPWFTRGWIIQEAAFSSNAVLFCGEDQVHMADFSDAVSFVRTRLNSVTPSTHQDDRVQPLMHTLGNFRDSPAIRLLDTIKGVFLKSSDGSIIGRKLSLESLVELATFCETTDPRDAVYALLNLANDADLSSNNDSPEAIVPNYKRSLLDVFTDFILHCFNKSNSLDIICRPWAPVSRSSDYNQTPSSHADSGHRLPSWIVSRDELPFGNPSWRATRRMHGRPFVGTSRKRLYNAHYSTIPKVRVSSGGVLHAKGIVLCEITQRSTRMADAIVLKECLDILGTISRDRESNLIDLPEVIWRTLCGDRDAKGEPASSIYRMAMFHLLQLCSELPGTVYSFDAEEQNQRGISSLDVEGLLSSELPDDVVEFLQVTREVVWNRRTFRSTTGGKTTVGLIPQHARVGDRVCVLYGCSVPVVLGQRKQLMSPGDMPDHEDRHWQLIGEAYVHGVMDGEAICSFLADPQAAKEVEFNIR
jgi:Heterokaryon incompatibility protein (HET)